MRCPICHQKANFDPGRVPGHPEWHLAPREMAWEGKTLGEICAQIKDRERNGGRSLEELAHHIGNDTLVGWAWAPGFGRRPAPGTQKEAGALVEAWVKTGAVCPGEMMGSDNTRCLVMVVASRPTLQGALAVDVGALLCRVTLRHLRKSGSRGAAARGSRAGSCPRIRAGTARAAATPAPRDRRSRRALRGDRGTSR